jgi:hypothetical protein
VMKKGDYVLVKRPFPMSLFFRPWVGEIVESYFPAIAEKYYLVRGLNGVDYCREMRWLTPISLLDVIARS